MLKQMQFNGEVVVVTGAGTGIGRATAEALAELGATVVLVARTQAKLDEVKSAIEKSGGKAEAFAADVSKEADVGRLRDFVTQKWGRAKAVINNAGNNFISPITDLATEKWRELIAVDLDSVYFMCRDFIPLLLKSHKARDPQRRIHIRAHRQRPYAGLLRREGWSRFADPAACRRLRPQGPARKLDLPGTHAVAAREGIFRFRPRRPCRHSAEGDAWPFRGVRRDRQCRRVSGVRCGKLCSWHVDSWSTADRPSTNGGWPVTEDSRVPRRGTRDNDHRPARRHDARGSRR